jgi:hypothetical protein
VSAIKTTITSHRQRYVDEPVFSVVSRANPLSLEINESLRRAGGAHVFGGAVRESSAAPGPVVQDRIEALTEYRRRPLRWVKPDGKGGFVPRR